MRITAIRVRHGDTVFDVHGDADGSQGVWLGKGQVDGIYEAPVKTTWKSSASQDGSRQKAVKWLHRDMELGFHVTETIQSAYEFNDSEFRRIFKYELDQWEDIPTVTTLEVETDISGTRCLDVLMYEEPEFHPDLDPIQQEYGNLILKLRAGQPMWYSPTVITPITGGSVTVENPTDQIMRHEWLLEPGNWTVPDYSWIGAPGARVPGGGFGTRTIAVNVTADDGVARISLDRQKLMIRNSEDINILARLGGRAFAFPIPPYTPPTSLSISGGSYGELHQPRLWSRPWGLELT